MSSSIVSEETLQCETLPVTSHSLESEYVALSILAIVAVFRVPDAKIAIREEISENLRNFVTGYRFAASNIKDIQYEKHD